MQILNQVSVIERDNGNNEKGKYMNQTTEQNLKRIEDCCQSHLATSIFWLLAPEAPYRNGERAMLRKSLLHTKKFESLLESILVSKNHHFVDMVLSGDCDCRYLRVVIGTRAPSALLLR